MLEADHVPSIRDGGCQCLFTAKTRAHSPGERCPDRAQFIIVWEKLRVHCCAYHYPRACKKLRERGCSGIEVLSYSAPGAGREEAPPLRKACHE